MEFKNTKNNVSKKTSCRKKNRPKIQNRLFLDFFYHIFGRYLVRGVQKHDKKYQKKNPTPSPFLYSDPPTHHGGHRFYFGLPAPWVLHPAIYTGRGGEGVWIGVCAPVFFGLGSRCICATWMNKPAFTGF
jgi:hypothetical protein